MLPHVLDHVLFPLTSPLFTASKWVAQISINCKRTHLGYFSTEHDAAVRYDQKALELGRCDFVLKCGNNLPQLHFFSLSCSLSLFLPLSLALAIKAHELPAQQRGRHDSESDEAVECYHRRPVAGLHKGPLQEAQRGTKVSTRGRPEALQQPLSQDARPGDFDDP